jgi:hypothetical protein
MVGYSLLLGAHVACGIGGLVALPVPIVARKGSPLHRNVGRVFVAAMVGAAVSGLALSALWILVPERVHPADPGDDPVAHAAALRMYGAFLAYLGWLIASSAWTGMRALRRIEGRWADRTFAGGLVAGGVALVGLGLVEQSWLFLAYGALGTLFGARDLQRSLGPLGNRRELHARAMLGTAIAGVTAFLALGARRWVEVPDLLAPVVWLGPTVLGIPLSSWLVRRDRAAIAV